MDNYQDGGHGNDFVNDEPEEGYGSDDQAEQERRWAALDASVPCAHTIPGTCDYC